MLKRRVFRTMVALIAVMLVASAGFAAEKENGKSSGGPFYLFKDGKATATIEVAKVPPEDACDLARAIDVFREDVARFGIPLGDRIDMTLRSRRGGGVDNRIQLVVEDRDPMTEDETVIDFPEEHVMRITGGKSGVVRALFRLLEEFGGVRYLGQGGACPAHFPAKKELAIPRKRIERGSVFPLSRATRQTAYYVGPLPRTRKYFWRWGVKLGAKARIDGRGHALDKIAFPIEEYRKSDEKPSDEMFPILHGKRFLPYEESPSCSHSGWQPCYTSEAALEEAVKNILVYLKKCPKKTTCVKLNVNDNGMHCQCERCLKMDGDGTNLLGYPNRSESYYHWVNEVAKRVSAAGRDLKEFPDVYFTCVVYREVYAPPSFKLHPNVLPVLLFDLHSWIDPEVMRERKDLLAAWAEKCDKLGYGGYDWGTGFFAFPRIYFREQQEAARALRDHGCVATTSCRGYFTFHEGPKIYLLFKLQENPDLDLEKTIMDWCEACVGKEAAPYLRKYYAFWEDFWRTKATKTMWWKSRKGIYLRTVMFGSYMFGLEKGDLDHCRQLMEKVVELANEHGTEDQKKRAATQMKCFEWSEAAAKARGAEVFPPDGQLPDVAAAVELLRCIPEACVSFEKWKKIPGETPNWVDAGSRRSDQCNPVSRMMSATGAFLSDPNVIDELRRLSKNQTIPGHIRLIAGTMLKTASGDDSGNLLADGSFEKGNADEWKPKFPILGEVSVSDEVAASGEHSLKCDIRHGNFRLLNSIPKVKPNTEYYFSAKIYLPPEQNSLEGRAHLHGVTAGGGSMRKEINLIPGKWNYLNTVIPFNPRGNSLKLAIWLKKYEDGDVVYIDDIQLIEIAK